MLNPHCVLTTLILLSPRIASLLFLLQLMKNYNSYTSLPAVISFIQVDSWGWVPVNIVWGFEGYCLEMGGRRVWKEIRMWSLSFLYWHINLCMDLFNILICKTCCLSHVSLFSLSPDCLTSGKQPWLVRYESDKAVLGFSILLVLLDIILSELCCKSCDSFSSWLNTTPLSI